jgi:hypothetical protein
MSVNQLVDRTVPNRSDKFFANQFIAGLVNQDKIIQRRDEHTLEIFNPATNACILRLRSSDRFGDIATSVDASGIQTSALRISRDAVATDFPLVRIFDGRAAVEYFQLLLKTGKVTAKSFLSQFELNSASDLILNAGSNILFQVAGVSAGKIRGDKVFVLPRVDVGDYGGNFANYTPPAGEEGAMVVAVDTNAGAPGKRLYIFADGRWNYVGLT